jgi:hypothetical protein
MPSEPAFFEAQLPLIIYSDLADVYAVGQLQKIDSEFCCAFQTAALSLSLQMYCSYFTYLACIFLHYTV